MEVANYRNDILHGPFSKFRENGSREYEGNYRNNRRNGQWMYFNEEDELNLIEIYEDGKIVEKEDIDDNKE